MKAYQSVGSTDGGVLGAMSEWESSAVDAVGTVIEFWGFKRNHGRVWALLYLRDEAMTASEIQDTLGLSKGAVSMVTRELELRGVLRRSRGVDELAWRFSAEDDLMRMIRRVFEEREAAVVAHARDDLRAAAEAGRAQGASSQRLDRLERMLALADNFDRAMRVFLATAQLDLRGAVTALLTRRR
jgi:DNA-binding transcriptional regulator GbsR (MarR family)